MSEDKLEATPQSRVQYHDMQDIKNVKRQKNLATNQGVRLHVEQVAAELTKTFTEQNAALAQSHAQLANAMVEASNNFNMLLTELQARIEILEGRWYNRFANWILEKLRPLMTAAPTIPAEVLAGEYIPQTTDFGEEYVPPNLRPLILLPPDEKKE